MAQFGAMLRLSNGNLFLTPDATPFCLYTRQSVWCPATENTSAYITVPQNKPVMAFVRTDRVGVTARVWRHNDTQLLCAFGRDTTAGYTATVYVFAIFPQTLPQWGMAIWNASGELVLTNESIILTDLKTIGTAGSSGGYNIDTSLPGAWAVVPTTLGATAGMGAGELLSAAYYNGSTTRFYAVNASRSGTIAYNHGNPMIAVNTSVYDSVNPPSAASLEPEDDIFRVVYSPVS
ncbi:hypothetical protein ACR6LJ_002271 [Escherichia coli]